MPKIKTHKSTAKRVKQTSTGKLLREKSYKSHFLSKKSSARKRAYGKMHEVDSSRTTHIKRALGGK